MGFAAPAFQAFPNGIARPGRLRKPSSALPPRINRTRPLASRVLFYAVSMGGTYHIIADSQPGHLMYPLNVYVGPTYTINGPMLQGQCRWGGGVQWPGNSAESTTKVGEFVIMTDTDGLRSALNLYTQAAGAGFTIACSFVPQAAPTSLVGEMLIFGRSAKGFTESAPTASILISLNNSSQVVLYFYTNGAGAASTITSSAISLNQFHTAVGSITNTSSGSATVTLYVDGVAVGNATGQAVADTLGQENNEGQLQFGSSYHLFADHTSNVFAGFAQQGILSARGWNAQEAASFHRNPWQLLLPAAQ